MLLVPHSHPRAESTLLVLAPPPPSIANTIRNRRIKWQETGPCSLDADQNVTESSPPGTPGPQRHHELPPSRPAFLVPLLKNTLPNRRMKKTHYEAILKNKFFFQAFTAVRSFYYERTKLRTKLRTHGK